VYNSPARSFRFEFSEQFPHNEHLSLSLYKNHYNLCHSDLNFLGEESQTDFYSPKLLLEILRFAQHDNNLFCNHIYHQIQKSLTLIILI